MKTVRMIVLIGAAVSLAVSLLWSLLTRMPRASRAKARKLLASADWLGERSKDGDLVKLKGIVRARDEKLVSPLSNVRCVALRIRVQARRGIDPRSKLVENTEYKPFDLEDAEGKVQIEPTELLFDVAPFTGGSPDATRRAKVLSDLGHPGAHGARSNVEETVLQVGANVTIAGTLATVDGHHRLVGEVACAVDRVVDLSAAP